MYEAMFTGIITHIGEIAAIEDQRGDTRFHVRSDLPLNAVEIGASIACSGVCLTVVEKSGDKFAVDVSAETLSKTHLGQWQVGTKINLERALKMGDELGGHIVSGHVDGLASIETISKEGDSHRLKISVPADLSAFIAPKGSVTLEGISLTVNEVEGNVFGVNIIPHTWDNTTLGGRKIGDHLHLEIDMLARYVARLLETQTLKAA